MQRGPLLQPLRSTELVLSGPPRAHPSGCVQPFRLRRAQHRQAHRSSHCLSFVGLILSHLSRSTEEANPPSGRVFLSAFAPQKPHSFPMGKPRFAPLPPRRIRLTPFPQSCHGFVLAPSSRQKPRQPRVSANLCCGVFHSRAEPDENPSSDTRKGFLWAQLFRSHEQPFLSGESLSAHTVKRYSSFILQRSAFSSAFSIAAAFGKIPPLLRHRRSGSPAGHGFPIIGKLSLRPFHECSATLRGRCLPSIGTRTTVSSNAWKSDCRRPTSVFFQPLEMGPPLRGPPINWGPVRYAPCFFLIFTGKLKHLETVTRCQMPFRFKLVPL